ncbi:MAG: hypothetical protein JSW66_09335, partial [Phycisphaerales bacterium]
VYRIDPMPSDEAEQRRMLEFARRMGARALVSDAKNFPTRPGLPEVVSSDELAPDKQTGSLIGKVSRSSLSSPIILTIEFTGEGAGLMGEAAQRIEFLSNLAIKIANGGGS